MPAVSVRNISVETYRALKLQAAQHGRSTEAEIRMILDRAVRPVRAGKLGSFLAELGQKAGGLDLEIERDRTPAGSSVEFE
jgi:plasmid stability protein